MSKCKVAPIKQTTIPRLELQAAVLSVKVDDFLRQTLDIKVLASYFWVDSEVVLKYIQNDRTRFHVFVGNRVGFIRQLTQPEQWHHIAGKENPADILTRSLTYDRLDKDKWFYGPIFLRDYKCNWPKGHVRQIALDTDDPEVRQSPTQHVSLNAVDCNHGEPRQTALSVIMSHFSSWLKMKRALAWWIRFLNFLRNGKQGETSPLSVQEVSHAGENLIHACQLQSYQSECERLSQGRPVKMSSTIRTLNPFVDTSGLIRVGGRLRDSSVDRKHPYIIPGNHVLARAIVHDVHNIAHVGVEWALGIIRKTFWIVKGRPLVKKVVKACVTCRRLYSKPCTQLMADLPQERTSLNKPPFTSVGIDVFGPMYVKLGRSEVKRYGCIFTCLSMRAIHIEKLDSLETDSFLNCLRRFTARRGCPESVFCDNGTNFVGGMSELATSLKDISVKLVQAYAVENDIRWSFIPPAAPHMGGAWERMIGVIKRVMKGLLPRGTRLTDEILETLFCEAESIVNNRPLTKLSDDPCDPSPLTPNHLLLLKGNASLPPGKFVKDDKYRRRWRHVQHLADQFWRTWLKLYLPELQKRSKWLKRQDNVKTGDLVLIADENTPRNLWPLAIVQEVKPGRDGLVRSVKVRTRSTELVRPITKIVLLEAAHGELDSVK